MKKMMVIVLMLVAMGLSAQPYEPPIDGLYESVANGAILNGERMLAPWIRIGVEYFKGQVHYLWDSDDDLSLEDEQLVTYRAKFYGDGIVFEEPGAMSIFRFDAKTKSYELTTLVGSDDMMTIRFVLLEEW